MDFLKLGHKARLMILKAPALMTQRHICYCHYKQHSAIVFQSTLRHRLLANQERSKLYKTFSTQPPVLDPNRDSRRQKLTLATYLSGFIGVCLLSAVGLRYYQRAKLRAGGVKEVKLQEYSHGRRPHLYEYRGFCLPSFFVNNLRNIHTFDVREDDIWVVSFPKAGTTWLQEIVYLIMNDVDVEKALSTKIDERVPYFEYPTPGLDSIRDLPSPRIIKSHLPFSLLPNQVKQKKPKVIYIARNPKDTAISFYSFSVKFLNQVPFNGTSDDYARLFVTDKVPYGPWWKHISEAWKMKEDDNVLVLFYEDLQSDAAEGVRKISEFLGRPLSEKQVSDIVEHTSFENMRQNSSSNYEWMKDTGVANKDAYFMRKGKVGDWRNHLSTEMVKQFDEMSATKLPSDVVIRDSLDG